MMASRPGGSRPHRRQRRKCDRKMGHQSRHVRNHGAGLLRRTHRNIPALLVKTSTATMSTCSIASPSASVSGRRWQDEHAAAGAEIKWILRPWLAAPGRQAMGRSHQGRLRHAAEAARRLRAGFHATRPTTRRSWSRGTWVHPDEARISPQQGADARTRMSCSPARFPQRSSARRRDCIIFVMQDAKGDSSRARCKSSGATGASQARKPTISSTSITKAVCSPARAAASAGSIAS